MRYHVILMIFPYIKDKLNLINYNMWSGTDYLLNTNDINTFSETITIDSSTEFSVNGNRSIKTVTTSSTNGIQVVHTPHIPAEIGETYTAELYVYNPNNPIAIRILESTNVYSTVEVPINSNWEKLTISRTIQSGATVVLMIFSRLPNTFYIDQVTLGIV